MRLLLTKKYIIIISVKTVLLWVTQGRQGNSQHVLGRIQHVNHIWMWILFVLSIFPQHTFFLILTLSFKFTSYVHLLKFHQVVFVICAQDFLEKNPHAIVHEDSLELKISCFMQRWQQQFVRFYFKCAKKISEGLFSSPVLEYYLDINVEWSFISSKFN